MFLSANHTEGSRLQKSERSDVLVYARVCEIVQDAVKRGDQKKMIEERITHGMRVELEDREGNTMILYAAKESELSIIEYLVEEGGNVKKSNNKGITPLHLASQNGDNRVVEYLLTQDISIEKRDNEGNTTLYCAGFSGDFEIVELFE